MTKADWLDFFEAINGRSATEEEIAARIEKSIKSAKSENEAQKLESLLA